MVVQHNLSAMNANRMLGITTGSLAKSTEKLSSGYRVNRAADDAAGLAISEKMRKQIRGLDQASANAEDGISAVQTAEGALTEVHDMLQRMNELAVKAANGTMSLDDRQTVQDEVDQLLTEIDRVAETTKFNELYLLKGDADTVKKYATAKDAGIEGALSDGATTATFSIKELKLGDTISIGGTKYTIGTTSKANVTGSIGGAKAGELITVDGVQYTVAADANSATSFVDNGSNGGKANDGISDTDVTVITKETAYTKIGQELTLANNIGTNAGDQASLAAPTGADRKVGNDTYRDFIINKGKINVKETLNFALHVGADADMNNKITVGIDAMDAAGLGIKGINVKDSSGASATYAIDSIADAIAKVSAQRSSLGAIQNRLEHTINNLDNVVENTTAAESQIRDTDMAEEMVKYSKNNILQQAGQSMLAQANQANQGVLSLLS